MSIATDYTKDQLLEMVLARTFIEDGTDKHIALCLATRPC